MKTRFSVMAALNELYGTKSRKPNQNRPKDAEAIVNFPLKNPTRRLTLFSRESYKHMRLAKWQATIP